MPLGSDSAAFDDIMSVMPMATIPTTAATTPSNAFAFGFL